MGWRRLGTVYVVVFKVNEVVLKRLWDSRRGEYKNYVTVRGEIESQVCLGKPLPIELPQRVTFLDTRKARDFSKLLKRLGIRKQDIFSAIREAPFRKGRFEPVEGAAEAETVEELLSLLKEKAQNIPQVIASFSAWMTAKLKDEKWTLAVEPLQKDTGAMTFIPRALYTGEKARKAFDVAKEMAGAFEKLKKELESRYGDWEIDYRAYGGDEEEAGAVVAAKITMKRKIGDGEYCIKIWAPFLLENRAFHISASLNGVHVYPLAPVVVKLPSGREVYIYKIRVFHTKNWLQNLLAKVDFLASPRLIAASRKTVEKLSEVPPERAVEVIDALEESRLVNPEIAFRLRKEALSGISLIQFLRNIEVSHPGVQAMIVSSLVEEPQKAEEKIGEEVLVEA